METTALTDPKFPHGKCECTTPPCGCSISPGPAAFSVERDGKRMNVCTRCDFSTDRLTRELLVTRNDDIEVYETFDLLGAFCVIGELANRQRPVIDVEATT